MIEHITGYRIANAIVMDNSHKGTFLIVEGVRDDALFDKFINKATCLIQIAHGKGNVIESIQILNSRPFKRALAVVDSDFDVILNTVVTIPNLIYSDYHDSEISIIESKALEIVLRSFANKEKLKTLEIENKKSIRELYYELATEIGYLRLASKKFSLGLHFKPKNIDGKPLTYSDFIDVKNLKFNGGEALITSVFNYSLNRDPKPQKRENILDAYNRVKAGAPYLVQHISNGHDITYIIQLSLKSKLGSKSTNEVSQKSIELNLIFAFDSSYFIQTQVYKNIKNWETTTKQNILAI